MHLLFDIVYAAHANGTHHKLALDALPHLKADHSKKWEKLFLKYSERYLEGSKDPDKVFKDFRNHVLHVGDNYWGGAPDKCREWYDELVRALMAEKWEDAVYAAGVLSHYYTDPIMPFHTAQSEAESAIHRAVEWTINKSYNDLKKRGTEDFKMLVVFGPEESVDFAADMVRQGAQVSHRYYSHLIAHYNFDRGVVAPKEGYNELGYVVLAELLDYSAKGFALILDEAIKTAGKTPPEVNLTAQTFLATLKIPIKWVTRKMSDADDRALVRAMYDELQATGKVVDHLPEDDALIRELHKKEVLGLVDEDDEEDLNISEEPEALDVADEDDSLAIEEEEPGRDKRALDRHDGDGEGGTGMILDKRPAQGPTFFLSASDDVEDAPSIGVKTAKRLHLVGVKTVQDLFDCDPGEVASSMDVHYITPEKVKDWQDQARLQITIPRLRGHDAQFLVACGYRTNTQVIEANPQTVLVELQAFLITKDGQRLVRVGNEPDLEEIKGWIESAKSHNEPVTA